MLHVYHQVVSLATICGDVLIKLGLQVEKACLHGYIGTKYLHIADPVELQVMCLLSMMLLAPSLASCDIFVSV